MQRWDTPVIAPETWPELVGATAEALTACGVLEVVTVHSWTESAFAEHGEFADYEWMEIPVQVSSLAAVAEERRLGFTLGRDDWFWRGTATGPFELLFCHEGDMHLETDDLALAQALTDVLASQVVVLETRKLTP